METTASKSNVEITLNKHLRAISDLHWSPFKPELLATVSYDAYVHLWDLRTPEKVSMSFCGWNAGGSQVKFNRVNEHILASTHDTDCKVWDMRKGSSPVNLITAHRTKIYGLDWSRHKENELLTCSQDTLVKIWQIDKPIMHQKTIETSSPCWRARYTPFGNGIVTMPQRRKDNNLNLWNFSRDLETGPVYTFSGHEDTPTEFVWRFQRDTAYSQSFQEYQLVTWSKDMNLRLWPITPEIAASVDYHYTVQEIEPIPEEKAFGDFIPSRAINISRPPISRNHSEPNFKKGSANSCISEPLQSSGSVASSISNLYTKLDNAISVSGSPSPLMDLGSELDRVSTLFPSVMIDRTNLQSGRFVIKLERSDNLSTSATKQILFQVNVVIPKNYPRSPPFFDIQKTWTMSMMNRTFLSRKLALIGSSCAKKNQSCIEMIVKYIVGNAQSPSSSAYSSQKKLTAASFIGSDDAEVDNESDSGSQSSLDFFQKTFGTEVAPESESSFGEDNGILSVGKNMESLAHEKVVNNVPFPRLCGATFSPTGRLKLTKVNSCIFSLQSLPSLLITT
jgi:RWD domain/WD domain, G-beta repeat